MKWAAMLTGAIAGVLLVSAEPLTIAASATPKPPATDSVERLLVGGAEGERMPQGVVQVASSTASGRGYQVLDVPADRTREIARTLESRGAEVMVDGPVLGATLTPDDPEFPAAFGPVVTGTTTVWDYGVRGGRTVIAVLDTGVDHHPDLGRALLPGQSVVGTDHTADATDWSSSKHGTKVALTAVARGNNGRDAAGYCWSCSILPVRVLDASGRGTVLDVAEGVDWAVSRRADIINLSLAGCLSNPAPLLEEAIRDAVEAGTLIVAAAGNGGSTPGCTSTTQPTVPASFPTVLGVAASNPDDVLFGFSSRGDWVELAAPGCHPTRGGALDFCGTSAASPAVSGIAGLIRSLGPRVGTDRLRELLESHAQDIGSDVVHGRVDALASYEHHVETVIRSPEGSARYRGRGVG